MGLPKLLVDAKRLCALEARVAALEDDHTETKERVTNLEECCEDCCSDIMYTTC